MKYSLNFDPKPADALMWIVYPVVSFLIVFFGLYLSTKEWKGFLGPEEVDAGSFVPLPKDIKRAERKQRARERKASIPTNTVD